MFTFFKVKDKTNKYIYFQVTIYCNMLIILHYHCYQVCNTTVKIPLIYDAIRDNFVSLLFLLTFNENAVFQAYSPTMKPLPYYFSIFSLKFDSLFIK